MVKQKIGPLATLVAEIRAKAAGGKRLQDIEMETGIGAGNLSRRLKAEENGKPPAPKFIKRLEIHYEVLLHGRKTIEREEAGLWEDFSNQLIRMTALGNVVLRRLAELESPSDPQTRLREIVKDVSAEEDKLKGAVQS
jgi:hypothetical protein